MSSVRQLSKEEEQKSLAKTLKELCKGWREKNDLAGGIVSANLAPLGDEVRRLNKLLFYLDMLARERRKEEEATCEAKSASAKIEAMREKKSEEEIRQEIALQQSKVNLAKDRQSHPKKSKKIIEVEKMEPVNFSETLKQQEGFQLTTAFTFLQLDKAAVHQENIRRLEEKIFRIKRKLKYENKTRKEAEEVLNKLNKNYGLRCARLRELIQQDILFSDNPHLLIKEWVRTMMECYLKGDLSTANLINNALTHPFLNRLVHEVKAANQNIKAWIEQIEILSREPYLMWRVVKDKMKYDASLEPTFPYTHFMSVLEKRGDSIERDPSVKNNKVNCEWNELSINRYKKLVLKNLSKNANRDYLDPLININVEISIEDQNYRQARKINADEVVEFDENAEVVIPDKFQLHPMLVNRCVAFRIKDKHYYLLTRTVPFLENEIRILKIKKAICKKELSQEELKQLQCEYYSDIELARFIQACLMNKNYKEENDQLHGINLTDYSNTPTHQQKLSSEKTKKFSPQEVAARLKIVEEGYKKRIKKLKPIAKIEELRELNPALREKKEKLRTLKNQLEELEDQANKLDAEWKELLKEPNKKEKRENKRGLTIIHHASSTPEGVVSTDISPKLLPKSYSLADKMGDTNNNNQVVSFNARNTISGDSTSSTSSSGKSSRNSGIMDFSFMKPAHFDQSPIEKLVKKSTTKLMLPSQYLNAKKKKEGSSRPPSCVMFPSPPDSSSVSEDNDKKEALKRELGM